MKFISLLIALVMVVPLFQGTYTWQLMSKEYIKTTVLCRYDRC